MENMIQTQVDIVINLRRSKRHVVSAARHAFDDEIRDLAAALRGTWCSAHSAPYPEQIVKRQLLGRLTERDDLFQEARVATYSALVGVGGVAA